ncbi:hypothetical protein ACFX13_006875 [Malus domestica]
MLNISSTSSPFVVSKNCSFLLHEEPMLLAGFIGAGGHVRIVGILFTLDVGVRHSETTLHQPQPVNTPKGRVSSNQS